jgi:hypothetical protein
LLSLYDILLPAFAAGEVESSIQLRENVDEIKQLFSVLSEYEYWVGRSAKSIIDEVKLQPRGWQDVFPRNGHPFPLRASQIRNYFNLIPTFFKLVSPDETGGSRVVIILNTYKQDRFGGVNINFNITELNLVTDPVMQGSYNYSETVKVGLSEREYRDVVPHRTGRRFYINPPNPQLALESRNFASTLTLPWISI